MKPRAPCARHRAFVLTLAAALLGVGVGAGCKRAPSCGPGQLDGCLAVCDQGKLEGCRRLGEALLGGPSSGQRVGAMLLERACQGGDGEACGRLAAQPGARASASARPGAVASAPSAAPPAPPQPCPLGSAAPAIAVSAPALPPSASAEATSLVGRCNRGEAPACTKLGDLFNDGVGVPRSSALAAQSYGLACDRRDAIGCRRAGWLYLGRRPTAVDAVRAAGYFQRGCMGSDPGSCAGLGEVALSGVHPTLTPALAAVQFQRACTNAYAPACRRLSSLLREGQLLPRDEEAAARIEGRSLDLVGQSCMKGIVEDCLLLGLWRERPEALGEEPGSSPRTSDTPSLEGALDAYRRACDGGHPAGCSRSASILDALGLPAQAAEVRARLESTCSAGDAVSCAELLPSMTPEGAAANATLLARACEMSLGRACALLGGAALEQPSLGDAAALLARACEMGDARGCEGHLRRLEASGAADLGEAQRRACLDAGGVACARLAAAVLASGDAPCARQLLDRACAEAPAAGACAEAAQVARGAGADLASLADLLDQRACDLLDQGAPPGPSAAAAQACARVARALLAAGQGGRAAAAAERSCTAGAGEGCRVLEAIVRDSGDEAARQRLQQNSLRACQSGDRAACERRFGPLPPPPASAPAAPALSPPPEPGLLSCQLAPAPCRSAAPALGPLLAFAIAFARRKSPR